MYRQVQSTDSSETIRIVFSTIFGNSETEFGKYFTIKARGINLCKYVYIFRSELTYIFISFNFTQLI